MSVSTYTDEAIQILGKCDLYFPHPVSKQKIKATFYVTSGEGSVLLSCATTFKLDLISVRPRLNEVPDGSIVYTSTLDTPQLTDRYKVNLLNMENWRLDEPPDELFPVECYGTKQSSTGQSSTGKHSGGKHSGGNSSTGQSSTGKHSTGQSSTGEALRRETAPQGRAPQGRAPQEALRREQLHREALRREQLHREALRREQLHREALRSEMPQQSTPTERSVEPNTEYSEHSDQGCLPEMH